jgi:hypothetical protein
MVDAMQNLLNKWALGNFFHFPLLLTTFHMLFSFVVRTSRPVRIC